MTAFDPGTLPAASRPAAGSPEAYLSVSRLVKSYDGRQQAVRGISLDIHKGEFVSFLGPSGSGKTTTLMMIAGFEKPSAGSITLRGQEISAMPPHKRNIGMVFQNYALFPHMTAAENVGFPLRIRKLPKAEVARRAGAALEMVGLGAFAARTPREMSGGQQQRVALARALVFEPDVLLLDEPLGALDKNLREQMQLEIKRIQRSLGITTIYVTHDQTEAMTMSDHIAVFSQGVIEQYAPPLDVYLRPATRFVGEFVGDSNFLAARRAGEGRLEVAALGPLDMARELPPGEAFHVQLRPENLSPAFAEPGPGQGVIAVEVTTLVNYGDSVLVMGQAGGQGIRARLKLRDAQGIAEGQVLRLAYRVAELHVIPG